MIVARLAHGPYTLQLHTGRPAIVTLHRAGAFVPTADWTLPETCAAALLEAAVCACSACTPPGPLGPQLVRLCPTCERQIRAQLDRQLAAPTH